MASRRKVCVVCEKCSSSSPDDICFYGFPKDEKRNSSWLSALSVEVPECETGMPTICSGHFKDTDFVSPPPLISVGPSRYNPRLKGSAVPSLTNEVSNSGTTTSNINKKVDSFYIFIQKF